MSLKRVIVQTFLILLHRRWNGTRTHLIFAPHNLLLPFHTQNQSYHWSMMSYKNQRLKIKKICHHLLAICSKFDAIFHYTWVYSWYVMYTYILHVHVLMAKVNKSSPYHTKQIRLYERILHSQVSFSCFELSFHLHYVDND